VIESFFAFFFRARELAARSGGKRETPLQRLTRDAEGDYLRLWRKNSP